MKGTGLGSIIFSLIEFLCTQGNRIGCRFITVDAYKTATPSYIKNGFQPLTKGMSNGFAAVILLQMSFEVLLFFLFISFFITTAKVQKIYETQTTS